MFLSLLLLFLMVNGLMVSSYLLAVLMGSILSLLATPLYVRLRRRKIGPRLAAGLVTVGVVVLVIGPVGLFVSLAVQQARGVIQGIQSSQSLSLESVMERAGHFPVLRTLIGSPAQVEAKIRGGIESAGKLLSSSVLAAAGSLPDKILQSVLALLTCFFMLIDGRRFVSWLSDKIPLDRDVRNRLYGAFKDTAVSTIWATLAAAAAQATVIALGFWILGVPGAVLAAGATFIFAWIPVLGSTPVWVAGAIYLYVQDSIGKMVAMLVIGAAAGIIDNFVRPLVLRGRADIHPLVSLVAIFGGIQMFGIFGVFLGPILTSALLVLLTIWPVVGRRFGLLPDQLRVETPSGIQVEPLTLEEGLVAPGEEESKVLPKGRPGNA